MSRFSIPAATLAASMLALALAAPTPALAQQPAALPAGTLTVTGTGEVVPTPQNRKSNASIAAAVDKARRMALPLAIGDGRGRAAELASVAGLTLGSLLAIADTAPPATGFPFPISPFGENGSFGPGRYCGTVRRSTFKRDAGGVRRRTGSRSVRSCRIPQQVSRSVTMTFAAGTPQ